jgi:hypothetical protein
MGRLMSDAEIRRRKKLQGHISQTTGALGLAALGGTLLASKTGGRATKAAFQAVGRERPGVLKPKKLRKATAPLLATSAGIGGAGAFNFASYTGAESRKRKMTPVTKGLAMDMGYYGEEGHPVELPEIKVPIEKAWEPVARNYDPEAKRHKRAKVYEPALAGAGAGATGAAGYAAAKGVKLELKNRSKGQVKAASLPKVKVAQAARHASAIKHGKVAAGLAAAGAAGLGGSALVHRGRKGSWQSYSKRGVSAFGVAYLNPSGQHRETEN